MKAEYFIILVLAVILGITEYGFIAYVVSGKEPQIVEKKEIVYDTVYVDNPVDNTELPVKVTVYQAVVDQCDEDPLVTADGSYITDDVYYQWCAVSRDLIFWHLDFGDTIVVENKHGSKMKLIVRDLMNARKHRQIDVLIPPGDYTQLMGCAEPFVYKDSLSKITKVIEHD